MDHLRSVCLWLLCAVLSGAAIAASGAEPLFETTLVFPAAPRNRPNYRIPAILLAPNGDLLVFAEKRNDGPGDLGDHDLVMKRSRDRGRTWGSDAILFDDGPNDGTDPTVALNRQRGVIWLFFLRDKVQFYCMSSADSGVTWSEPRSLHAAVTRPEWDRLGQDASAANAKKPRRATNSYRGQLWTDDWVQRYGVGPGSGAIQLARGPKGGRILVPVRHLEADAAGRFHSFSHVFLSDDHGVTWRLGPNAVPDGNECRLIELANGDVMINARDGDNLNRPDHLRRFVAISHDGGDSWKSAYTDPQLACPQCHASLCRYSTATDPDRNCLLFCNPNSGYHTEKHPYGRLNLSVRLSYDEGRTWTTGTTIYPYASAYSDMAVLPDRSIALVYERGPQGSTHYWDEIQFAHFDLAWVEHETYQEH